MAKITCPKNPGCSIDCPHSGYAFYIEPYGPCVTGCDEQGMADAIFIALEKDIDIRISGIINSISGNLLARFALRAREFSDEAAADFIDQLERLSFDRGDYRFSSSWADEDFTGVLRILAESSSGDTYRAT